MAKIQIAPEKHRSHRTGWLRAAVLGANDGIISTASLIVGVAAAHAEKHQILLSSMAGLVAGAMAMAAGEFVSVSSQADTEQADLARERDEISTNIEFEKEELAQIYVSRGLDEDLARQVAVQMMAHDAIGSHARDELGIIETLRARPIQASIASALTFAGGALLPLIIVLLFPLTHLIFVVAGGSLLSLVLLGTLSSWVGGAKPWKGAIRVGLWGALAMAATAFIGSFFGHING